MNMGMIPQMTANLGDTGAQAATATTTGQNSAAGDGFATVLVHIVGSQTPSGAAATPVANQAIAAVPGMGQWEMTLADGEAGELLRLIGQLLESSDEDAAQLSPEDQQQFEAVLSELSALLIAISMLAPVHADEPTIPGHKVAGMTPIQSETPPAPIQTAGDMAPIVMAQEHTAESMILPPARNQERLQSVLTAIAARLEQGDQATRQWFRNAVEPQLAALTQLLAKSDVPGTQQITLPAQVVTELDQPKPQPTSVVHAGSHLQRLSQLANPPAALISDQAASAAEGEQPEPALKGAAPEPAPVPIMLDGSRWQPHQLKPLVSQPVPVQSFPDTVSGMVMKQFDVTTVNGISEARISLFPEHLGQVDVKITIVGGQLTAMFMAENGLARELLENGMNQLRSALQQQGLQVERLQVTQSDQAQQMFQEQRQPGSGEQHTSQQQKSPRASTAEDSFEEELIEETVVQELGYGNAINVTA